MRAIIYIASEIAGAGSGDEITAIAVIESIDMSSYTTSRRRNKWLMKSIAEVDSPFPQSRIDMPEAAIIENSAMKVAVRYASLLKAGAPLTPRIPAIGIINHLTLAMPYQSLAASLILDAITFGIGARRRRLFRLICFAAPPGMASATRRILGAAAPQACSSSQHFARLLLIAEDDIIRRGWSSAGFWFQAIRLSADAISNRVGRAAVGAF